MPTAAASVASGLIVLGDGVDGGLGLWRFEAPNHWTALATLPAATGIARFGDDLAISGRASLELRPAGAPATAGTPLPMKWQGPAPTAKIVALDRSPNGAVAIATADGESQGYWLVAADGTLETLQPAPTESFTPLVAWLDDTRLLVLTTDRQQASRLAVVDVAAHTIKPSMDFAGVRVFALSADRRYLAAATGASVYAGSVEAFLGTGQPATVAAVDSSAVVWGLAFDPSGTQLAWLSGMVAPDGLVTSVREIGYAKGSESWVEGFDSPAPFGNAMAQVWMP
ncbi:MAG: hypothetical protein ABSE70_00765 [Candidatus Limnocylindrales bacterium]